MALPDETELSPAERGVIEAALEADPDLSAELAMIIGKLKPEARAAFWRAFAAAAPRRRRPAAAVLPALERAAMAGGRA